MSQGYLHGNHWAYFYNTVATVAKCEDNVIDISNMIDNGKWDKKLESLGIKKIPLTKLHEICKTVGVTVKLPAWVRFSIKKY